MILCVVLWSWPLGYGGNPSQRIEEEARVYLCEKDGRRHLEFRRATKLPMAAHPEAGMSAGWTWQETTDLRLPWGSETIEPPSAPTR